MHCLHVGTALIYHPCNVDNPDQQFELKYVNNVPGCPAWNNKLFSFVEPGISLGGYGGCVTAGPEQITSQMCDNYVEETQTFFIRPMLA